MTQKLREYWKKHRTGIKKKRAEILAGKIRYWKMESYFLGNFLRAKRKIG